MKKYSTAKIKYPLVPSVDNKYIRTEIKYPNTFHQDNLAYDMGVEEEEWMIKQLNSLTPIQVEAIEKYLSFRPVTLGSSKWPEEWDNVAEIMMDTMTEHQLEAVRIYRAASYGYMDFVLYESAVIGG